MANYFSISVLNGFDWFLLNPVLNQSYNTIPPEYDRISYNPNGTYFQKWQTNDAPPIQLLSDFIPTLNFYDCRTKQLYRNVAIPAIANSLLGVTFRSYQAVVDFSDWDTGRYYGQISYGDAISPTPVNYTMSESEDVDGNLTILQDNEVVVLKAGGGSGSKTLTVGSEYKFKANSSLFTTDGANLTLIVKKNDEIIFQQTIDASVSPVNIIYGGIVQSGVTYDVSLIAQVGGEIVTPINIPDDNIPPEQDLTIWQTSPFDLAVKHEDTLKFEYKNSYNTLNMLFQSPVDLTLQFRVEGVIIYVDPESETELYTDQEHNVTEESSIAYFNETLLIGGTRRTAKGVPEWVIRKMALIFTCDQKRIDGLFYEKATTDAKFTPTRPEVGQNTDAFWSLPIIRNEDFYIEDLVIGDNPDENELQVIVRAKEYLLNGSNIVLTDTLKKATRLAYIQITNRDLESFNVLVGTSDGGMDLGVYTLSGNICDTLAINKGFNTPTTLFISGLTGHDTDVWIEWHQLDDKTQLPDVGGGGFVKNVMYPYYELNDGDFENDFSVATGLGNVGTKFEGCALMDGRNGTTDIAGMGLIGWDRTSPATRQTVIGAVDNFLTIDRNHLPAEGIEMFTADVNTANGDTPGNNDHVSRARSNTSTGGSADLNYEISKSHSDDNWVGRTKNMGNGAQLDITPFSLVTAWFIKITD